MKRLIIKLLLLALVVGALIFIFVIQKSRRLSTATCIRCAQIEGSKDRYAASHEITNNIFVSLKNLAEFPSSHPMHTLGRDEFGHAFILRNLMEIRKLSPRTIEECRDLFGRNERFWDELGYTTNPPSALHFAARDGDNKKIQTLLAGGAAVNATDEMGWTPLHYAVFSRRIHTARQLLQNGSDVNAGRGTGVTPLHEAATGGDTAMAAFLLDKGADINAVNPSAGTPLHEAVINGHPQTTRILLERGADPAIEDSTGRTPLQYATASDPFLSKYYSHFQERLATRSTYRKLAKLLEQYADRKPATKQHP